jgi:hypothetical protein
MAVATPPGAVIGKRLNIVLSDRAHTDLVSVSRETRRSMTELIRLGLGLLKIAVAAERDGHRLIVTTADGQPLKEIVLPG